MHWLLVSTHWLCTRRQFNPWFESISSSINYFHTHNGPFVELERGMLSLMGVANASKSLSMGSPSRMQMTLSARQQLDLPKSCTDYIWAGSKRTDM